MSKAMRMKINLDEATSEKTECARFAVRKCGTCINPPSDSAMFFHSADLEHIEDYLAIDTWKLVHIIYYLCRHLRPFSKKEVYSRCTLFTAEFIKDATGIFNPILNIIFEFLTSKIVT